MNPNRFIPSILSTCLLIAACADDPGEIIVPGSQIVTVNIEVGVPAANIPETFTRSLTESDERTLHTVDLLLFEIDGTDEKFAARTHNTNNLTSDGSQYQTITANFEVDDSKIYRLVILANLRDEVDDALGVTLQGDLKETVLRRIIFSHNTRWPSKDYGTTAYRPLPMWGEATQTTAINKYTTSSSFGTIQLLRAQALIQLAVNIPQEGGGVGNGKDFFEIEEVKVYNAHRDGYAVPLSSAAYDGQKVTAPSIVGPDRIDPADMSYVMSEINPYHENALYNTIYVNECLNAGQDMADAMYLIIKGYYTEPGATQKNETKPTWYRIDFYDRAEDHPDAGRIDILRNHSYLVNINYIGGPGEEDEETAKNTLPVQMRVDIVGWSDGQTTDVAWNGMYMLGVSKSHFELNNYGHAGQMFTVITNYPKGWTARVEDSDSWIELRTPSTFTGINRQDEFYFDVAANTGNPERTGYIILAADNLELKVKVEQSDDEITIEIVDFYNIPVTEVIFYSPKPLNESIIPAKLFQVRWTPADRNVFVSEEVVAVYAFDFRGGNGITHGEVLSGGWRGYTIAPPEITAEEAAVDPFMEKASRYYFTLGDQTPFTTNITLRHIRLDLVTDEEEQYEMDGGPHSFYVRSNVSWEATVWDPDGVLDSEKPIEASTGGYNTAGELFTFNIADNSSGNLPGGTAVITFSYFNAYGDLLTHDVEITAQGGGGALPVPRDGEPSNCYLLKPSGEAVRIPVRQANADGNSRIGASEALEWRLIWTDHANGIDEANGVSPVRKVELEGTGTNAQLVVYGGSEPGNAVIAITKSGSSDPLWSWHIWVTDFTPDDSDTYTHGGMTFMDRNLGSLVNDTDSYSFGDPNFWRLFYQWGRKDPFPQASSITSNEFRH
ncbi:MAG: BACON domain-containing protein, partial [Rikenellaceae bacterium]|nr:BACON domain-containing protein [Rikenellaceae bacterium]